MPEVTILGLRFVSLYVDQILAARDFYTRVFGDPEYTEGDGTLYGWRMGDTWLTVFDTASAIFWMYNDCWPAVRSWTIVDYLRNRTPAFWAVRRAMQPVQLFVTDESGWIHIYAVNDTLTTFDARVQFGVLDLSHGTLIEHTHMARISANSSSIVARFEAGAWKKRAHTMPFAMLLDAENTVLARARMYELVLAEMEWPTASVDVSVKEGKAVFTSDRFAWGVCIDLDGTRALDDNFFDVWPGLPYAINWPYPEPPTILHIGNSRQETPILEDI